MEIIRGLIIPSPFSPFSPLIVSGSTPDSIDMVIFLRGLTGNATVKNPFLAFSTVFEGYDYEVESNVSKKR